MDCHLSFMKFSLLHLSFIILPALGFVSPLLFHALKVNIPFAKGDFLYLVILMPIIEELIFRQGIYSILIKLKIRIRTLIILCSLTFALYHLIGLSMIPQEYYKFVYIQVVLAFLVGICLTWMRFITHSIIPGMILHSLINSGFLLGIVYFRF